MNRSGSQLDLFTANAGGGLALLSATAAAHVPRFVFSSSCAVHVEPSLVPISESATIRPRNPHGESKDLVERALAWFEPIGISHVSVATSTQPDRPDGSHGDRHDSPSLVPMAIRAALGQGAP